MPVHSAKVRCQRLDVTGFITVDVESRVEDLGDAASGGDDGWYPVRKRLQRCEAPALPLDGEDEHTAGSQQLNPLLFRDRSKEPDTIAQSQDARTMLKGRLFGLVDSPTRVEEVSRVQELWVKRSQGPENILNPPMRH